MSWVYEIRTKYPGNPVETVEENIKTREELRYLLIEYNLAFQGSGHRLFYVRVSDKKYKEAS